MDTRKENVIAKKKKRMQESCLYAQKRSVRLFTFELYRTHVIFVKTIIILTV